MLTFQEAMLALGPRINGGYNRLPGMPERNPYARRLAGLAGAHMNQELPAKAAAGKQALDSVSSTLNSIRQAMTIAEPDLTADASSAGVLAAAQQAISALQSVADALAAAIPGAQQNYGSFQGSDDAWNAVDRAQQAATSALTQYRDLPSKISAAARTARTNLTTASSQISQQAAQQAQQALANARQTVLQTVARAEEALSTAQGIVNDAAAQGADTSDAEGQLVAAQAEVGTLRSQATNAPDQSALNNVDMRAASAVSRIGIATSSAKRALMTYQRMQQQTVDRKAADDAAAQRQIDFQQAQLAAQQAREQALADAAAQREQFQQQMELYKLQMQQQMMQPQPQAAPAPQYVPGPSTTTSYYTSSYDAPPYGYGDPYALPGHGPPVPPVATPDYGGYYEQSGGFDPAGQMFGMPGLSGVLPRSSMLTEGYSVAGFDRGFIIINTPEGDQVRMSQAQASKPGVQVADNQGRVFYRNTRSGTSGMGAWTAHHQRADGVWVDEGGQPSPASGLAPGGGGITAGDVTSVVQNLADTAAKTYQQVVQAKQRPYTPPPQPRAAWWSTGEKVVGGVAALALAAWLGPKIVKALKPKPVYSYPAETYGF